MARRQHPQLFPKNRGFFFRQLLTWLLLTAIAILLIYPRPTIIQASNPATSAAAPFNQPGDYPLEQAVAANQYQPVGAWVGRLILPTLEQVQAGPVPIAIPNRMWHQPYMNAFSKVKHC